MNDTARVESPWRPLRQPLFRALWIATVFSYIGTWIHDVAAAWMMTTLRPSPVMVSMIATVTGLAMMLLALPAGAIADIVDRRRLLLVAQVWMMVTAIVLGVLALAGLVTPWVLLSLRFTLAIGNALNAPAWSAILPEMVGSEELPAAIALNSISFNLARAVGPALGGLLVASAGPPVSFLLDALSFLGVIAVLYGWRRERRPSILPAERLRGAMRAGLRYVRHAPSLQAVLVRTGLFIVFGSSLWALMPLIAKDLLHRGPAAYGVLLGFMGGGALVGAAVMPRVRQRMGVNGLVSAGGVIFAASLVAIAHVHNFPAACAGMAVAGAAWLVVLSTLSVVAQQVVPEWVRARAMAVHLMVFFAGFAGGSALWGYIAGHGGIPVSLTVAAAGMVLGLPVMRLLPMDAGPQASLEPARHWRTPEVAADPHHDQGPVLITIVYKIDTARVAEFARAMRPVRRMRLRDGAIRWGLWHDAAVPGRMVESFVVESWLDHLRQHERVTHADREVQEVTLAFHIGPEPPVVSHFVAAADE